MPKRGPVSPLTPEKRAAFLACLRAGKIIADAAKLAGTSRSAVNRLMLKDPTFRAEVEANRQPEVKLTPEARKQACNALAAGAGEFAAARLIGVSQWGWSRLKQRDPSFKEEILEAKAFADDTIQRSLFWKAKGEFTAAGACLREPDTRAAIVWLMRRRPQEWAEDLGFLRDPDGGPSEYVARFDDPELTPKWTQPTPPRPPARPSSVSPALEAIKGRT